MRAAAVLIVGCSVIPVGVAAPSAALAKLAPLSPAGVTSLDPARLFDSRAGATTADGQGAGSGALLGGETIEVGVVGRGGVPESGVAGVVVNLTIARTTERGFASLFPCGQTPPNTSNVNWTEAGLARSAAAVSSLSESGSVCVRVSSAADVIVDVNAWIADPPEFAAVPAGGLGLVDPARLFDSRAGRATVDGEQAGSGRLESGETVAIDVAGRAGIGSDAAGVALSIAAVNTSEGPGFVTVFPCGVTRPEASTLNFTVPGAVVASGAYVPLGVNGEVCVFSSAETDLIVDVFGFVAAGELPSATEASGALGLLTPSRMLDTRRPGATIDGQNTVGRLAANDVVRVPLADRGGVPSGGITGAVLSVTAVNAKESGYLTVWGCGNRPTASNVNFAAANRTVANSVMVAVSDDAEVCVFASAPVDVVVDVLGYITGEVLPSPTGQPNPVEGGAPPVEVESVPALPVGDEAVDLDGDGFLEDVPADVGYDLPELVLPGGGRWQERLGQEPKAVGDSGEVFLAAGDPDDVGRRVIVEILDPTEVERTDFQGLAVAITPVDGLGPVEVELGFVYRPFDTLFGGDWAERLAGHVADECVWTTDSVSAACAVDAAPVSTVNDLVDGVVTMQVEFPDTGSAQNVQGAAGLVSSAGLSGTALEAPVTAALQTSSGGRVAGLLAEASGSSGDFGATPLAGSGSWAQGGSSGSFNWSYGFGVPSIGRGGPTPGFGVSYSSQMVDGMTSNESSQPGIAGLGWSFSGEASIERSYSPCTSLGGSSQDLCWDGHQVSLNLDGVSSRLVPLDASFTEWRLERDNGWRVFRRLGGAGSAGVATTDNNGEYWEIVTLDGNRYRFGYGQHSGQDLNSVWTVPVISANAGDPCRTAPSRICNEGWKWMLDQVVDPVGITQVRSYQPEVNYYGARGRDFEPVAYVRGGTADTVWWGIPSGGSVGDASHSMSFQTELRCAALSGCTEPTSTSRDYPDVPTDLICTASGRCRNNAPGFFTTQRLRFVTTSTIVNGVATAVDRWQLTHEFVGDARGALQRLWLRAIKRTGLSSGLGSGGSNVDMPAVRFESLRSRLANRADANPRRGVSAIEMFRVDTIRTELGAEVSVTYAQPDGCAGPPAAGWERNTQNCYPEWFVPKDFERGAGFAQFNVYVVSQVKEGTIAPDAVFSAATSFSDVPLVTNFEYLGGGAYRHAQRRGVSFANQSWSQWRGYQTVVTRTGSGQAVTTTESTYLRGLDQNRDVNGTKRSVVVTVPPASGSGGPVTVRDDDWLMGYMLMSRSLEVDGSELSAVTMLPTTVREVTGADMGIRSYRGFDTENRLVARMMRTGNQWSRTADTRGGRYAHVTRRTDTFEAAHGRLVETYSTGDVLIDAAINNDQCVSTSYATPGNSIEDRPSAVRVFEGECSGAPLSTTQLAWDPQGRLVSEQTAPVPASTVVYGASFGRPERITDPTGAVTTISYTSGAAAGAPAGVAETVSSTNALGHTSTVGVDLRGNTVWSKDSNGNVATATFDRLGRMTSWVAPDQQGTDQTTGSVAYTLDINNNRTGGADVYRHEPTKVTTSLLVSADGIRAASVAYIDGLGRTYQTQSPTENKSGRLIAHTVFDERGHAVRSVPPTYAAGVVGSGPAAVPDAGAAELETVATFDALGRSLEVAELVNGVEQLLVVNAYDGYVTTSTATGQAPTRTTTDAFGRTVSMIDTGTGNDNRSRYDARGLLIRSGPDASRVLNTYDAAGRLITVTDPNAGTSTTTYDVPGRHVVTTDAEGDSVRITSDELGRPVSRETTSGQVGAGAVWDTVATWSYDRNANENGLLFEVKSFQPSGEFVKTIDGYDEANRPLGVTYALSSGETYTESVTEYSPQGVALESVLGAFDVLGEETITTELTGLGAVERTNVTGLSTLNMVSTFDELNRTEQVQVVNGADVVTRGYGFDDRRRLENLSANVDGAPVQDNSYEYDAVSNIVSIDHVSDVAAHRECFGYDSSSRLVDAYTVQPGSACGGAVDLGVAPAGTGYRQEFVLGPRGRILGRTTTNADTGPSGQSSNYVYGDPGAPDALTQLDSVGIVYNNNGARSGTSEVTTETSYLETLETPQRLADTRLNGPLKVPAGGGVLVDVTAALPGGLTDADVSAVMVNVVLVAAEGKGSAVAFPNGGARPSYPIVASEGSANIAQITTVGVDDSGRFRIGVDDAAMHVVVDLVAVYVTTSQSVAAGRVVPVTPYRAYDSRDVDGPVADDSYRRVGVADASLPADAVGVVATVTVVGATETGFLSVFSDVAATATEATGLPPTTSTINYSPGGARANQVAVVVSIDVARQIAVYARRETNVIVDVTGYVTGDGSPVGGDGLFVQLANPLEVFGTTFGAGGGAETVAVGGLGGIPTNVAAVSVSVSLDAFDGGFVSVVPAGVLGTEVSSVNARAGERLYGVVTSGVTDGEVRVAGSGAGNVNVAVTGYYVSELPLNPVGELATSSGPVVYEYDRDQRLVLTRTEANVETGFEYWETNERVAQHLDDGSSVFYLGSLEATRDRFGEWTMLRRTYVHGGAAVASRTVEGPPLILGAVGVGVLAAGEAASNVVSVLLGNHQGSVTTTIGGGVVSTRYYTPYGERRGADPLSEPTTTGFIGQHEDDHGLVYLNNRHYDPSTGVFVSVDPLVTITGEPYIYAGGNPVSFADPSGLAKCSTSTYVLGGPAYGCTEVNVPATGGNTSGGPPSSGDVHSTNSTPARGWSMPSSMPQQWKRDRDAARDRIENGSVPPNWQDTAVAYGCYPSGSSSNCASSTDTMMAGYEVMLLAFGDPRSCVGDSASIGGCGVEVASILPWGKSARVFKAFRFGDEAADVTRHGLDYHPRIRARGVEDGVGHNFPYSFDDVILGARPITQGDGSLLYRLPGALNSSDGIYEIAVNPGTNVIFHRLFRSL